MKKTIALFVLVFGALILSGCSFGGGAKVETDGENLEVNTPSANVKIEDGNVEVDTPGAKVKTGNDGVEVDVSGGVSGEASQAGQQKKRNVVLVMDASGSMNAMLDGKSKMDIAKESAGMLVDKMKDDVNLSVVSYGHIGGNTQAEKNASCNGIEEVYYFGGVNGGVVKSKINGLPAKGWTPIAKSLEKAKAILAAHPGEENEILLISDGEETCGGDPVALAKEICAAGVRVDVIGFDVSGASEVQLKNISINGCGAYASVDSASDFGVILDGEALHVRAAGTIVDIEGGNVKVETAGALVEVDPSGVNLQTDAADVNTQDGGVDVRTDEVTVKNGKVDVDMPSVPSVNY